MNGNAVESNGTLVHCEHGRRCLSRGGDYYNPSESFAKLFDERRINSPNDIAVAPDGTIWFMDPTFGIIMPNQGALADPELDHCSAYRFDPVSGVLARMADFEEPNGLGFTADGHTHYVSDTSLALGEVPGYTARDEHEIIAFDVGESGALSNRRFFPQTDHGYLDGFAVEPRGWICVATADGVHIGRLVAASSDSFRLRRSRPAIAHNITSDDMACAEDRHASGRSSGGTAGRGSYRTCDLLRSASM
jgi:gluconolactonase